MAVSDATLHRKHRNLHAVDVFAIFSTEQLMDSVADHCRVNRIVRRRKKIKYSQPNFYRPLTYRPFHAIQ